MHRETIHRKLLCILIVPWLYFVKLLTKDSEISHDEGRIATRAIVSSISLAICTELYDCLLHSLGYSYIMPFNTMTKDVEMHYAVQTGELS